MRKVLEELINAKLQLEYLNQKFPETGTTNAMLKRIESKLPEFEAQEAAIKELVDWCYENVQHNETLGKILTKINL